MTANGWLELIERNPEHSTWYIERFRSMAAAGDDLDGEARFVDAMVARSARILDAGCGPGRVGGRLDQLGHEVVGVDLDPVLIDAAEHDHPGPTWVVGDLAELDLPALGVLGEFDAIVCAGNVMPFLAPHTRRPVLDRLGAHLGAGGRLVYLLDFLRRKLPAHNRRTPNLIHQRFETHDSCRTLSLPPLPRTFIHTDGESTAPGLYGAYQRVS